MRLHFVVTLNLPDIPIRDTAGRSQDEPFADQWSRALPLYDSCRTTLSHNSQMGKLGSVQADSFEHGHAVLIHRTGMEAGVTVCRETKKYKFELIFNYGEHNTSS